MKSIIFDDQESFNAGLSALETNATPDYAVDHDNLTILTDDVTEVTTLLIQDGVEEFIVRYSENEEPFDGFRNDVEADADALASAGFGTDEDYGGGVEDIGGYDE